jgi:radical SAM superfamily enzyme YgiQ (UPF0313 family)
MAKQTAGVVELPGRISVLRSDLNFEVGPIRPPSEAHSLLIRATRNCPWNRCHFCPVYKGEKFSLRTVEEIKKDIQTAREIADEIRAMAWKGVLGDRVQEAAALAFRNAPNDSFRQVALWLYFGGESVFLQDANTLVMRTPELVEVLRFLRQTFPQLKRVTIYARSHTAARKKPNEYQELLKAGLDRIHIGLETGYDPLLEYIEKGCTAEDEIKGGKLIRESGIEFSEYVMPGLGGKKWSREHAEATASVLNEIDPHFIRIRSLVVPPGTRLWEKINRGEFEPLDEDGVAREIHTFISRLKCHSRVTSDHIMNLLEEVEGKLPEDKTRMLAALERYLGLDPEDKLIFRVGRRLAAVGGSAFRNLDELDDPDKREAIEELLERLNIHSPEDLDEAINKIREQFI